MTELNKRRLQRLVVASGFGLVLAAPGLAKGTDPPEAQPAQASPMTVAWMPYSILGEKPRRPSKDARKIRIVYGVGGCVEADGTTTQVEELDHIAVQRRTGHVTITVHTRSIERQGPAGPYGDLCAGIGINKQATVSMRGRLGKRAVRDGHFTPPRVVWKARR